MNKRKIGLLSGWFGPILWIAIFILVLIVPYLVFAEPVNPAERMRAVANQSGYYAPGGEEGKMLAPEVIGGLVRAFLGLLGIIFIILILISGYNWMTAGGNEDKVNRAITTIRRSIIGLIIVVGSYAIWNFVFVNVFI